MSPASLMPLGKVSPPVGTSKVVRMVTLGAENWAKRSGARRRQSPARRKRPLKILFISFLVSRPTGKCNIISARWAQGIFLPSQRRKFLIAEIPRTQRLKDGFAFA